MFNNGTNFTMPVAPIAYTADGGGNGGNGAWGDGYSWIWILLIFAIFGWGGFGNGFGGGNGGTNGTTWVNGLATRADINEGFALNNLQSGINGIQQGICSSTYEITNQLNNGFHNQTIATMQGFNGVQSQLANCCCDLGRSLERGFADTNYNIATQTCAINTNMATNTRDIIDANNNNTRQILDFLVNDKIASLTAKNQSLKFQASQNAQNSFITANQEAQTAELIRRIAPPPVPAYVVPAPFGYGCCNSACGC